MDAAPFPFLFLSLLNEIIRNFLAYSRKEKRHSHAILIFLFSMWSWHHVTRWKTNSSAKAAEYSISWYAFVQSDAHECLRMIYKFPVNKETLYIFYQAELFSGWFLRFFSCPCLMVRKNWSTRKEGQSWITQEKGFWCCAADLQFLWLIVTAEEASQLVFQWRMCSSISDWTTFLE